MKLPLPRILAPLASAPIGVACTLFLAGVLAGCSESEPEPPPRATPPPVENPMLAEPRTENDQQRLDAVVRSEDLIEQMRAQLGELAFAIKNLQLPDARTRELFWPAVLEVWDLAPEPAESASGPALGAVGIAVRDWPVVGPKTVGTPDLDLWRPLLDGVARFEHAKLKIKSGRFVPGDPERFETDVKFTALAVLASGELSWVKSMQKMRWRPLPGKDVTKSENWRIESWELVDARRLDAPERLFEEVVDFALPSREARSRARFNIHERLVADRILASRAGKSFELPHDNFIDPANDRQPGVAVVDIDRDGFDDIYVMLRLGKNQFFRNLGNGRFEEVAGELGIDVDSYCSAALFADFDNDGDDDLFLGRTERRSLYFENVDGRFADRSGERFDVALPYFVSGLSAADYDQDGLLDLYVTTYSSLRQTERTLKGFLDPGEVAEVVKRRTRGGQNVFYDSAGPPNVLFHNGGAKGFTRVRSPGALASWRNSFQATWSDFDGDGDPDLYLSNDFAPDAMIRNDGEGRFVDVSEESGITHFGLGMGASWGDYDRDGELDLYATNMYSTAGTRITDQLTYLNPKIADATAGNYLYRNQSGSFEKVSERKPPGLAVQETGWSWSSQFGDVDNDGYLDLAVLNGFYTAPREVALSGDT
ncbi:MAG: VCBS repeat-containing protein [Myxococcota bacterium]